MKQTIVIFEGHDKSGKTTIAAMLSKIANLPVFKVQRNKYHWDSTVNLNYLTEGITQFLEQTDASVILDRWHGSDYMYGQLFDRDVSQRKIFELDERLAKLDAHMIICYKDESAYIEDVEDKEFITMNDYSKMTAHYREFAQKSKCKILFLNTSNENLKEQLSLIIKFIYD